MDRYYAPGEAPGDRDEITDNQQDCQNAIESRIADLERRIQNTWERQVAVDEAEQSDKSLLLWRKLDNYADELQETIDMLTSLQFQDDFESMADYLNDIKYKGRKWKSW